MAGPLKNQRHEAFAQGVFQGKPAYQAYIEAGFKCTRRAADTSSSDLLKKPDISARIAALAGKAEAATIKKIVLTKEWVVDEMIDAARAAKDDKTHSARIRALELLGRETGNFTEQKRVTIRSFAEMSAEEIEAFLAGQSIDTPAEKTGRGRKG